MINALYKTVRNTVLTWKELSEVVLDIEIALNNRPMNYVEEDIQQPVLTPNAFLFIRSNTLPELAPHHQTHRELRKRAKILTRYKDALWSRLTREYLRRETVLLLLAMSLLSKRKIATEASGPVASWKNSTLGATESYGA